MELLTTELIQTDTQNPPSAALIAKLAHRLREELCSPQSPSEVSRSLAETCRRFSSGKDPAAQQIVEKIANQLGWSEPLLQASLRQLLRPFLSEELLAGFARRIEAHPQLLGFVMAGNIPGAGLLEVIIALLAGCVVMIKAASSERWFFSGFAQVLAQIDPALAHRVTVLLWPRERTDLSDALRAHCDRLVVFGDDETIASFADGRTRAENGTTGFGARVSGAVLAGLAPNSTVTLARLIATDVSLFEQRGCLSPNHIFVFDPMDEIAPDFAAHLAAQLENLASDSLPVAKWLPAETAAAIRHAREQARWRALGGDATRLWEGPIPGWTVIYDHNGSFQQSPGYRTAFVSPFTDPTDLDRRLMPVKGRVEACAFSVDNPAPQLASELRRIIEATGASHICAPGEMQSPPLDWPHGGGIFRRLLSGHR